ncbi:RecQ family ATP-dependent DNA helicase [Silvibacterium dinghuense]|uniref:ATP-dependent DNA helicase RecQ n=1 Tax=Silvibacterium dinghuense TaxID=1560006 RepID=A0A4Q1SC54_9BACT|nr:ATP-dependent DNA helicase RecQ [Silvibacterium dinghuense]RXS94563.1 ATP-dependent DNA helicase RecQ [Silvibacterium dinghuense]GGH15345.1 hypothetical protein GCM10011586_36350 [Silvibacterium dinghuense]
MTRSVSSSHASTLHETLHRVFGFRGFRANQEAVCAAAMEGRDVLLVMPTGSGKSLCYQLPAIARGGTALVISPLIALMDDQAAKLAALGLRVERIHSGLDREAAREACRQYLAGQLQFLFIAPERLRVPGFAEMLAKRKPNLIAIDEAHCISQWGHDFRPDYRLLGRSLEMLKPAPVMALTATATPTVQKDIVKQLGLAAPAQFIHGFRRDNLAIEVVEVSKPRRAQFCVELLQLKERRPAIVYAPTRRDAETTAETLSSHFPSAAYHAGMDAGVRERVQREFLEGRLEVVVATIAFGMGIDKADVRTVIHTALPSSVEGYYQEIGRAGRDGLESRTILMHSFADRRTHDFFYQRDYPEMAVLDRIAYKLGDEPQHVEDLRDALKMDQEIFQKALEKLVGHGGAAVDFEGMATKGAAAWRDPYARQCQHRQEQIEKMLRFADGGVCRMRMLVEHFGDDEDAGRNCGLCDFCAAENAVAQVFRPLKRGEEATVESVARALRSSPNGMATGRLYKQLFPSGGMDRDEFESLLVSMARSGYAELEDTTFEKDGKMIPFRRITLTDAGEEIGQGEPLRMLLPDAKERERAGAKPRRSSRSGSGSGARSAAPQQKTLIAEPEVKLSAAEEALEKRLRAWRSEEAKKHGFPAFRIFGDKTLRELVLERPQTQDDLLRINGIGPEKATRFGESICAICAG